MKEAKLLDRTMEKQRDSMTRRKLIEKYGEWEYTAEKRDKARLAIRDAAEQAENTTTRVRLRAHIERLRGLAGGNGNL